MLIRQLIFQYMKKRIYLILLFVTAIFFSCKDNKEFVEQLFTNNQISIALKQCIDSAALHTCNALCVVAVDSGYSHFEKGTYRLELPAAAKKVLDTLLAHASCENDSLSINTRINSLIDSINRAAEQCGNDLIRQFWKPTTDSIVFPNPNAILHGGDHAITDFVKQTKQTEFISALENSILKEQFNELQIITAWDDLQKEYFTITGIYSSVDILAPTAQQMAAGFFRKMALEEAAIRKDPKLQGNPNGWLYKVFATL
jgi:hypothetical protein